MSRAAHDSRLAVDAGRPAAAFSASEARFERLIEQLPAIIYETDAAGRTVFTSRPEWALYGYPRADWEADPDGTWRRALHPDDRDAVLAEWGTAIREGIPHNGHYRMIAADGREVWLSEYESVVRDDAGNVVRREGVAIDVTAQVEAEQAQTEAELRYRALIEQLPVAAYVQQGDGRTDFLGPQIEHILGYPRERWWAEPGFWKECIHPDDRDAAFDRHDRFVRGGESYVDEYRMIRADGETRWLRETAAVIPGDGTASIVQGVVADVTDRRTAEGLLREQERQRMSVLAAMVAAEEDERHRIAGELHDDSIQVMTATLFGLDRMIRAAEAGDAPRAAIGARAARETLAEAAERTRLSFELRPPALEMHGVGRAVRVLADELQEGVGCEIAVRTRLRRYDKTTETLVFRSVREALTNVRKHARATHVDVALGERGGVIECLVADDGVGFDVEEVRAPGRLRLHFGLDALEERLRLAGGALHIDSEPGRGTRVALSIPVVRRAA